MRNWKVIAWVNLAFLNAWQKIFIADRVCERIYFGNYFIVGLGSSVEEIRVKNDRNGFFLENLILHMDNLFTNFQELNRSSIDFWSLLFISKPDSSLFQNHDILMIFMQGQKILSRIVNSST